MKTFKEFLGEASSLNKDNKVFADDTDAHPFVKAYTAGNKGDHRPGGSTDADDKASEKFNSEYDTKYTKGGFGGSGVAVYTHKATGKQYKVTKQSNGKGFYGTDHIVSVVK